MHSDAVYLMMTEKWANGDILVEVICQDWRVLNDKSRKEIWVEWMTDLSPFSISSPVNQSEMRDYKVNITNIPIEV
jgi:hypothetical protein